MKWNKKQLLCTVLAATMTTGMLTGCVPKKVSQPEVNSETATTATTSIEESIFNVVGLPIVNEQVTYEIAAKS